MSVSSIAVIMGRIGVATPDSQIAVFKNEQEGMLDAVFANTVNSLKDIRRSGRLVVGVFDKSMDLSIVRKRLVAAC